MERKEVIRTIKERIKAQSLLQSKAKWARKTVHIDKAKREALIKELSGGNSWYSATGDVIQRKGIITALLNYYHEARGSEYKHGIRGNAQWSYDKAMDELRKEFPLTIAQ